MCFVHCVLGVLCVLSVLCARCVWGHLAQSSFLHGAEAGPRLLIPLPAEGWEELWGAQSQSTLLCLGTVGAQEMLVLVMHVTLAIIRNQGIRWQGDRAWTTS